MEKYFLKQSKTEKTLYTIFNICLLTIIALLTYFLFNSSGISILPLVLALPFLVLFFIANQLIFFMNKLTYYEIQEDKVIWKLLFMKLEIPFSKFNKVDLANDTIHARIFNRGLNSKYTIKDILKSIEDFNEKIKTSNYAEASKPTYDLIEKDTVYKRKIDKIVRIIFVMDNNIVKIRPKNPGLFLKELTKRYESNQKKELKIDIVDIQS